MRNNTASFRPGFRLSLLDGLVLAGVLWLLPQAGELAFVTGFVLGHFFLFCNVFRIRRGPELIWAGGFIILAAGTLWTGLPGWGQTAAASLVLSSALVLREFRHPGYHGVFWKKFNPGLPKWWEQQHGPPQDRAPKPQPSGLSEM